MSIGGLHSPAKDGGDPTSDKTLIKTAMYVSVSLCCVIQALCLPFDVAWHTSREGAHGACSTQ